MSSSRTSANGRWHSKCVACGGEAIEVAEVVSVRDIARLWARDFRERGRDEVDESAIATEIAKTLGRETIQFDRCLTCGVEMASPARAWAEGEYPSDQIYPVRWEFGQCLDDLDGPGRRILELGCGNGTFLEMARERGHEPLGMDYNKVAVEAAQAKGLNVVLGGFDDLRRRLDTRGERLQFDAVAMFHVIEHLEDPHGLFAELEPFIHDTTQIFVSCPGPRRYTRLMREICVGSSDYWDFPPHHVLRWNEASLRAFFEQIGWKPVRYLEEPLEMEAASASIGCLRASEGGYLTDPVRRRLAILWARIRILTNRRYRAGVAAYFHANRN